MSNIYIGQTHVFTSRGSNDVITIKPGYGETLNIEGASVQTAEDTQVLYNNSGTVVGSEDLTYLYSSKQLNTTLYGCQKYTDDIGYNQLSVQPQSIYSTNTGVLRSQGTRVAISEVVDGASKFYVALGCPYYIAGASLGGVSLWQYTSTAQLTHYGSLIQNSFTLDAYNGKYCCDISEDGLYLAFSDGGFDGIEAVNIYRNNGSGTWSAGSPESYESLSGTYARISTDGSDYYFISADTATKFVKVYTSSSGTSNWSAQQTLLASGSNPVKYMDMSYGVTAIYQRPSDFDIYIWNRSGVTWTNDQTITFATELVDLQSEINKFIFATSSDVYIYERTSFGQNYTQTNTFALSNILGCTIGTTYAFVLTTTKIYIYKKVSGVWTLQGNQTTVSGATTISCNDTKVVVGVPGTEISTYGGAYVYDISTYTNTLITTNLLTMGSDTITQDISLENQTANGNIIFDSQNSIYNKVDGTSVQILSGSSIINRQPTSFPDGTVSAPGIVFENDPNTGIYRQGADSIGLTVGGSGHVTVSTSSLTSALPYLGAAGSAANPSISFSADTNTGIYSVGADNLGISTGGTKRWDISTTAVTNTLPVLGADGTVNAPAVSFSADTNTGLYRIGADNIGIATNGTKRLDVSTTSVNTTLPIYAADGSVSAPSYSNTTTTGSGMYFATDNTLISQGGTNILRLYAGTTKNARSVCAINRSGNTCTSGAGEVLTIGTLQGNNMTGCAIYSTGTSSQGNVSFFNNSAVTPTEVGYILTSGSTTTYSTTSDISTKENIEYCDDDKLLNDFYNLKVRKFDWKVDKSHCCAGLIAQEVKELMSFRTCVQRSDGRDLDDITDYDIDTVDDDDKPMKLNKKQLLAIDFSKFVPSIIRVVQCQGLEIDDLNDEIRKLRNDVNALKNKLGLI